MKKLPQILAIGGVVMISSFVVFIIFFNGRTGGPDLIEAIHSGKLDVDSIESIDVVAPQIGSMPFLESEYARLKRIAKIDSPSKIKGLLDSLSKAEHQFPDMNHPVVRNLCYFRINTKTTWYWVYCEVLDDGKLRGLEVWANTAHATNANGGGRYFLDDMKEILTASGMKD